MRLRFSVRWLMVIVAVVAFCTWYVRLQQLSAVYRQRMIYCDSMVDSSYKMVYYPFPLDTQVERARKEWEHSLYVRSFRDYWKARRAIYRRACRYPWLSVEVGPPDRKYMDGE